MITLRQTSFYNLNPKKMRKNFTIYAVFCLILSVFSRPAESRSTFQHVPKIHGAGNNSNGIYSPVRYLSVSAIVTKRSVNIAWVTVSEINDGHFEVERSFDMADFKTIGLVLGGYIAENKNANYQFRDYEIEPGCKKLVYYRLKQIDPEGKVNYSTVIVAGLENEPVAFTQDSANPFNTDIKACFNAIKNNNMRNQDL